MRVLLATKYISIDYKPLVSGNNSIANSFRNLTSATTIIVKILQLSSFRMPNSKTIKVEIALTSPDPVLTANISGKRIDIKNKVAYRQDCRKEKVGPKAIQTA